MIQFILVVKLNYSTTSVAAVCAVSNRKYIKTYKEKID